MEERRLSVSDEGVTGRRSDAAHIISVARHHDVSLETPRFAPAVLYQPIIFAALSDAVSHNEDPVVKLLGVAIRLVIDAALVQLEALVAGINSNGDRTCER